jgi:glycosyltransferase involved in cell wall biosynthesis
MKALLKDPAEARRLGRAAQRTAHERFNIERFAAEWSRAFIDVAASTARAA